MTTEGSMIGRVLGLAGISTCAVLAAPTFSKDVAPVFYRHCVQCHHPDDVAPMSLLDYRSARPWAKAIREAVLTRKMPPWFAGDGAEKFSNDPRLSAEEVSIIEKWVDSGATEGNRGDLPQ